MLIADGVIQEAGPRSRVENLAASRGAEEFDVTGRVVMPGFVDCHTHLVCGPPLLKDYDARIAGEEPDTGDIRTWSQSIRSDTAGRLESRARKVIHGMARHGTTTLEAKTGYGLDATGELKILRVIRAWMAVRSI